MIFLKIKFDSQQTVIQSYDTQTVFDMHIKINFKSAVPVYHQIVEQVKSAVASGQAGAGTPLPSIRPLSQELRINRNTVAKAYTELETQGVIETRPGKGSFIAEQASPLREEVRMGMLNETIDALLVEAHHLQITEKQLRKLLDERLKKLSLKK